MSSLLVNGDRRLKDLLTRLVANEQVVTLLLVMFSIGIGIGSLLCEKLSGHKIEIGLVPFGSIGMTVFAVDLYFSSTVHLRDAPIARAQPHLLGLVDEVADRQDEPVFADHHRVAGALGAERLRGKSILRHD